ncbi:efflux RND transporter periplasmic adaptor subunit [Bacteroides helcogenes]|uniref:Efflux transporter, RND family, MFP subunit n=1 Tax=Bacteroides helcogenes (strain ATCC 35417 / DSM 20613 / JCM 6297 / CCUG 15421 / P 36-108) TaxID=693979 RepID=E6SPZ4_BACT6|nr:efflux RND transporter periplasmic adaptor subunit [Bacteroides helcogenes]ADV42899.1 efflux transporter, RND family, MFP subunit [Bacteroides helcogenes P 36-108]MDY5237056.1 efflux RND transporter periplasmic adaptor subunit [Bacteroides helcogenes]
MKVSNNIIAILFIATSISLVGCNVSTNEHNDEVKEEKHADEIVFTQKQADEAGMELETVKSGEFMNVIKVSGQIRSPLGDEQTVVATANGIISFSNSSITDGASVGAGQSIVIISAKKLQDGDPTQKARIAYETAEREYRRSEGLVADKIISAKEFEQVRLRYETAKAAYQGQATNITANGVNVSSPISGFIKNRLVKQGDFVSVGDPIVTVTQNRRLQLRAEVPEKSFRYLKNVNSANFKAASDDKTYKLSDLNGKLLSYGKTSDTNSFYLPVTFEFDNVGDFVAGSFAEVYLLAQPKKNVMSVPMSALTEEQGVYYVYVQVKDEKEAFLKKEVVIGQDNGERIEIIKGLTLGDKVVVKGAYQVKLAASSSAVPEGHNH